MSTRNQTQSINGENRTTITVLSNGNSFVGQLTPEYLTWVDTVTHGDNVPGWRKKLREGSDATTSLSGSKSTAGISTGRAQINNLGGWRYEMTGDHLTMQQGIPSQDPSTLDESKANAEALARFNRAIRRARTTFEGGVFLGELGQTLRMIRNPAQGLRKATDDFLDIARAIRRGGVRSALARSKVTEHLSDAWLEVQFGWRPFMNDVRDGCKALDSYNTGHSLRTIPLRGSFQTDSAPTISNIPCSHAGAMSWTNVDTLQAHVSVSWRGAMRVAAQNPHTMDPALLGFDPRSFAPTVWELIPYSFLIDYFTNIGDLITGWSNIGTNLAWCNSTSRKWYERTTVSVQNKPSPFSSFTSAKFVSTKKSVLRQKRSQDFYEPASLVTRVPSLGSLRWLNIAALIGSRNADRRWSYD